MLDKIKYFISGLVKDKREDEDNDIALKKTGVKQGNDYITVIKDRFPDYKDEKEEENIELKFPINKGDIIKFKSGNEFQICKSSMKGAINTTTVSLKWINKSIDCHERNHLENVRFGSIRELNYHLENQKHLLKNIKKDEKVGKDKVLNVEECYQLALEENVKRDKISNFFKDLESKKNKNI